MSIVYRRIAKMIVSAWLLVLFLPLGPVAETTELFAATPASAENDVVAWFEERQRAVAELMEKATVFVMIFDKDGDFNAMGSGFVVAEGYVLTNAHVAKGAKTIYIANSALKATRAKVVKIEKGDDVGSADFALLSYSASTSLPVLSFNPKIGRMDRVSAWGFPFMITKFDQSIEDIANGKLTRVPPVVYTEGTVSAIVSKGAGKSIIHTAAIAGGNSGGPLVNSRGEVVGINTWGATEEDEGAFVNASIPTERILRFLQSCGITPLMSRRTTMGVAVNTETPPAPPTQPAQSAIPAQDSDQKPSEPAPEEGEVTTEHLLDLAQKGDAEAQLALGGRYLYGEGVPEDNDQAEHWLKKAAAQGELDAAGLLGIIYLTVEEKRDTAQGRTLLKKAADANDMFAAIWALLLYEGEGYGVARDVDEAFNYASKGAEAGDADSKALLAMLYYHGEGCEQDIDKALELNKEALKEDSMLAQSLMARMYYFGDVVEEDSQKAFAMAQNASEAGETSAMGLLAVQYYSGDGVEEDLEKAEAWARRASDAGNEFGHFVLAKLYYEGSVVPRHLPMAWAYATMAKDKGMGSHAEGLLAQIEDEMTRKQARAGKAFLQEWRQKRGLL